jgi:hypothetical protein
MTSISLHTAPPRGAIWGEQLRAVGVAIRTEALVYVGVLAALSMAGIIGVWRARSSPEFSSSGVLEISFASELMIPISLIALFIPLVVWRTEEPSRRSYHWSMPVNPAHHTLAKVAAGWLWALAAAAVFVFQVATIGGIMAWMAGTSVEYPRAWEWAAVFTTASIAYLLGSAAAVGSEHPWRWIAGLFFGVLIGKELMDAFGFDVVEELLERIATGHHGLSAAIWGDLRSAANGGIAQWIGASIIWGALAIAAVGSVAFWRTKEG